MLILKKAKFLSISAKKARVFEIFDQFLQISALFCTLFSPISLTYFA